MNIEKIKKANTSIIGKEIFFYEELESTQDTAKQIIKDNNVPNGTIIITSNQTNGKGTKERIWYSDKGKNITMTIIVYTKCKLKQIDGITIQMAKQIANVVNELYNINLQIKKPNDLMLNNKKIAGILTQTKTIGNELKQILIGIGFNVNQATFTNELEGIATSLKIEYEKEYETEEIIIAIIEKLEILFKDKKMI